MKCKICDKDKDMSASFFKEVSNTKFVCYDCVQVFTEMIDTNPAVKKLTKQRDKRYDKLREELFNDPELKRIQGELNRLLIENVRGLTKQKKE